MAPQLRRWCWRSAGGWGGAEPHALRPRCPPPARPLAAPSSRASPPRAPPPLFALRLRLWRPRSSPGLLGGAGGEQCPWEQGGAAAQPPTPPGWDRCGPGWGTRGWSRLRPVARAGLKEERCRCCHHHRSGPGPSVQPSLPPPPVWGCWQPGLPRPACPPGSGREMAPRLRLLQTAPPPPSTPVAGRRGAMCWRGLALDWPFLSLPWRQEGPLVRWGRGRGVSLSHSLAGSPPLLGNPRLPERRCCPGGRGAGSSSRAAAGLLGRKTNLCRSPARR